MFRHRSLRTLSGSLAAALPLAAVATATTAQVAQAATLDVDAASSGVGAAGTATFCSPIFGTGKSVGVPVVLEDAAGEPVTDLDGYTFRLTDGTDTQDVTDLMLTPEEQPLAAGDSDPNASASFQAPALYTSPGGDPTGNASFAFTDPGHYFLACTPDTENSTVVFPEGMLLQAVRDGAVIAEASVADRSAHGMADQGGCSILGLTCPNLPERVRPSGTFVNDNIDELYLALLDTYGIPLNRDFAQLALLSLSNAGDGQSPATTCWDDLLTVSGSTWSWTTDGTALVDELTGATAATSSFPLLDDLTHGVGVSAGLEDLCDLADDYVDAGQPYFEADQFLAIYTAQLLLIDGPAGRVTLPVQVRSGMTPAAYSIDTVLAPAVRLAPEQLPDTGADSLAPLLAGLAALAGGAAILALPRRRRA